MGKQGNYRPDPGIDLERFAMFLKDGQPFRFSRFSDGELFIIRNERLEISQSKLIIGKHAVSHQLPSHDHKLFDPETQQQFREDLIEAAQHQGEFYFIGLPGSHNKGLANDRDQIIDWRGGISEQITFADLLINSNYKRFTNEVLPTIVYKNLTTVVGNFRTEPKRLNSSWELIPVPDNFLATFPECFEVIWSQIAEMDEGRLVLASASSLSNLIATRIDKERPDLTMIDIGTALHPMMGLGDRTRDYHVQIRRPSGLDLIRRAMYRNAPHFRIHW
jgi:hypothetical protein